MATTDLSGINRDRLLVPSELKSIIQEIASSADDSVEVKGSLLDHKIDEFSTVLDIETGEHRVNYETAVDWPASFPDEKKAEEHNHMRDAFLRSDLAEHLNVDQVMEELRNHDDVVIGVDGNILRDCVMTSTLLEEIYAETFPNWILVGIPRLVMSAIERRAKDQFTEGSHPRVGWLTYRGRIGHRTLQEVMNLREKNPDRPGLAMMTVGDLQRDWGEVEREDWKIDALIRDQYQDFLDDIGFHKGTFFLSENRVNVMMTGTEGGDALYLQKPEFDDIKQGATSMEDFTKLIYELCVQFGSLRIKPTGSEAPSIDLSIYWPGKQISDWANEKMNIVSVYD